MPTIHVTDALGRHIVNIDKPLFTIGRRSETDLRLPGADISRVEIRMLRTPEDSANAIGGSINMVRRSAFETAKRRHRPAWSTSPCLPPASSKRATWPPAARSRVARSSTSNTCAAYTTGTSSGSSGSSGSGAVAGATQAVQSATSIWQKVKKVFGS